MKLIRQTGPEIHHLYLKNTHEIYFMKQMPCNIYIERSKRVFKKLRGVIVPIITNSIYCGTYFAFTTLNSKKSHGGWEDLGFKAAGLWLSHIICRRCNVSYNILLCTVLYATFCWLVYCLDKHWMPFKCALNPFI